MNEKKDFKVGDCIREIKTGREMEVVGLIGVYDVDEKKYGSPYALKYSYLENGDERNKIGEISISEVELIE